MNEKADVSLVRLSTKREIRKALMTANKNIKLEDLGFLNDESIAIDVLETLNKLIQQNQNSFWKGFRVTRSEKDWPITVLLDPQVIAELNKHKD